ncbi:hypothetical protein [Micromonospora sp. NPDC049203]|uniref:hypothetical protein n=1 Tax=Micromonospora sp. NPDC049203 TaxID=3364267 RepID=UPI0037205B22
MQVRSVLTALAVMVTVSAIGMAPAHAESSSRVDDNSFASQARAGKLSERQAEALQGRVDVYLQKTGGKQISLNEIKLDNGVLRVAVPGEAHPRDFVNAPTSVALADRCLDGQNNGWFCAYSSTGFQGDTLQWYTCGTYNMPWTGYGSWRNNQTSGTVAKFINASGSVIYSTPGAYSSSLSYVWTPVYKVKPC